MNKYFSNDLPESFEKAESTDTCNKLCHYV